MVQNLELGNVVGKEWSPPQGVSRSVYLWSYEPLRGEVWGGALGEFQDMCVAGEEIDWKECVRVPETRKSHHCCYRNTVCRPSLQNKVADQGESCIYQSPWHTQFWQWLFCYKNVVSETENGGIPWLLVKLSILETGEERFVCGASYSRARALKCLLLLLRKKWGQVPMLKLIPDSRFLICHRDKEVHEKTQGF